MCASFGGRGFDSSPAHFLTSVQRPPPAVMANQEEAVKSHSQLGQDVWVYNALGHKRGGFFVELGAGDGIELSNTYALEKHFGWIGVCIECSRQFEALRRNRRCACDSACVSGADGESVVFLEDERYGEHNHFSGIKDKINCHQPSGKEYELKVSANIFWVLLFKKGES